MSGSPAGRFPNTNDATLLLTELDETDNYIPPEASIVAVDSERPLAISVGD